MSAWVLRSGLHTEEAVGRGQHRLECQLDRFFVRVASFGCNVEQADQVFAALQLRKVPCRYVRYPRSTSHGMSRGGAPDMRLHRLHEILRWWSKYLSK